MAKHRRFICTISSDIMTKSSMPTNFYFLVVILKVKFELQAFLECPRLSGNVISCLWDCSRSLSSRGAADSGLVLCCSGKP